MTLTRGKAPYDLMDTGMVDVRSLGAKGDGSDDSAAINTISRSTFFPPGTYGLEATHWNFQLNDVVIKGAGLNATYLTTASLKQLVKFNSNVANVVFEDMTFEATTVDAVDDVYGLINGQDFAFSNITFNRCRFTCPDLSTNAFKMINQTADIAEYITFRDCQFINVGRMGIEFQNHITADNVRRYRDVHVIDCVFKAMGSVSNFGMGVSLSGYGTGANIDRCIFDDCDDVAVELVGVSMCNVTNNIFKNNSRVSAIIACTNTRPMTNNIFTGNRTTSSQAGNILIRNQIDPIISDNHFEIDGYLEISETTGLRGSNNKIISGFFNPILIGRAGTTTFDNILTDTVVSNVASASNWSVIRFTEALTTNNQFKGVTIDKASGGVACDQLNSALGNTVIEARERATALPFRTYREITMTDADYDLSGTEINILIPHLCKINGTLTAPRNFVVAPIRERYSLWNNTTHSLVVKLAASTGAALLAGEKKDVIYNSSTNDIILV